MEIELMKNILSFLFKSQDVYIASYPRSGNTWFRVLLANIYFKGHDIKSLVDLQKYIPDEHATEIKVRWQKIDGEFYIKKTHHVYSDKYIRNKSIYIYRNPIDVAWSYFNFLKDVNIINDNTDSFVKSYLDGSIMFGSWDNHVASWVKHPNKIILSYEELVSNTQLVLNKTLSFVQSDAYKENIEDAIINSSAEVVRKITDDEIFYGQSKPEFVTSPLKENKENKRKFIESYKDQIMNSVKHYDFDSGRLKL
jgi:hypothetical protein